MEFRHDIEEIQVRNHASHSLAFRLSQIFLFGSQILNYIAIITMFMIFVAAGILMIPLLRKLAELPKESVEDTLSLGESSIFCASTILIVGLIGEWFDSDKWKKSFLYTLAKLFVIAGVAAELIGNIVVFQAAHILQKLDDNATNEAKSDAVTAYDKAKSATERAELVDKKYLEHFPFEITHTPRV